MGVSSGLPNLDSFLKTGMAVLSATLPRLDTLLFAKQAGCHAKQRLSFRKQAKTDPLERGCFGFLARQMTEELTSQRKKAAKGRLKGGQEK